MFIQNFKGHGGLTIVQWFICLGFAAICFFVSFILKLIPESGVPEVLINNRNKL